MPSALFLAMTAAEFYGNLPDGTIPAWMACHFSPYGTGLSNCPQALPEGSMLIVNDRTPVCGHDPAVVAAQLKQMVTQWGCSRVLLDFQMPGEALTQAIASAVVNALPCPVGVSEPYARDLACPVFLPPLPLHMPLDRHTAPWQGREIWLEAAMDTAVYTVTQEGCLWEPCQDAGNYPHTDAQLHCRYHIHTAAEKIVFTLHRDREDLLALMAEGEKIGCFVGLYQELGSSFAQAAAQSTARCQ